MKLPFFTLATHRAFQAAPDAQFERLQLEADAHRDAGRRQQAAACYAAAVALRPDRDDLRVQQGNMLKDSGFLAEAERLFRDVLQRMPADADVMLQLGRTISMQGRGAEAEMLFARALDVRPELIDAALELLKIGTRTNEPRPGQLLTSLAPLAVIELELTQLRAKIDEVLCKLPDFASLAAFPIEKYDAFRQLYDLPAPPSIFPDDDIVLCVDADAGPARAFHALLDSLRAQTTGSWRLMAVAETVERRAALDRFSLADARVSVFGRKDAAMRTLQPDTLVLALDAGIFLHPAAVAWCIAAVAELRQAGQSPALFFDEEGGAFGRDGKYRATRLLAFGGADVHAESADVTAGTSILFLANVLASATLADVVHPVQRDVMRLNGLRERRLAHLALPLGRRLDACEADDVQRRTGVRAAAVAQIQSPGAREATSAIIGVAIPTRDNPVLLEGFVDSLLETAAQRAALRFLIVDNGSESQEAATCLERLSRLPNLRVHRSNEVFNWSRLNNIAARQLGTDLLLFANDDMRMLSAGWDNALRAALADPKIGAVSARLIYPDETLQHCGVLAGWRNGVINEGFGRSVNDPGPSRRWAVPHLSAAAMGAFLATSRGAFDAVGGFDEAELPIAFSDTDFCFKLRARDLSVLITPTITVIHHESTSRGRDDRTVERQARYDAEEAVMRRRWSGAFERDPSYHPFWDDGFEPFRLLSAPSGARIIAHLLATIGEAWRIAPTSL